MNPPPYQPPQEAKNPIMRQAVLAGLIALPVVVLIGFVVAHAVVAHRKTMQSRAVWKNVASSANQMRSDLKKDYNPKTGITNIDFAKLEKLRETLNAASVSSTGDEAVFAKSLTGFMDRMQFAAKNYHESAAKLRAARVLYNFDSSDKEKFAPDVNSSTNSLKPTPPWKKSSQTPRTKSARTSSKRTFNPLKLTRCSRAIMHRPDSKRRAGQPNDCPARELMPRERSKRPQFSNALKACPRF
jgi:hypothetical protein